MMSTEAGIYVGRDAIFAISQTPIEEGASVISYDIGTVTEFTATFERTIEKVPVCGKEEPYLRRSQRTYTFTLRNAFIDTTLLRFWAGHIRGEATQENWTHLNNTKNDGDGNIFDDFPQANLILTVSDDVNKKKIITLQKIHPQRFVMHVRAAQYITFDMTGMCENTQIKEE